MYLHGSFYSIKGDVITVYILTDNDKTKNVVIGEESSGVFFAGDDPCNISCEINDTFDHLIAHSATITLLSDRYISDLYQSTCRNAMVTIYKGNECIFAGFLEPQTFSQDYNETLDEVQLNCIDCLSALQYSNYKNIGASGVSYAEEKAGAGQRTFLSLMTEMLSAVWKGTDIPSDEGMYRMYYDGSKKVDSTYSIFSDISINDLLFLDEDEDSVWTQQTVLEELMRYLNLHIMQVGASFYIFSWETLRNGGSVTWKNITGSGNLVTESKTVDITTDIVADCGCQIEVGDTYNQLSLTDSVKEIENVIDSPLDDDSLTYAYDGKQKYMTEYIAAGEGSSASNGFKDLVKSGSTDYDGGSVTDWFVQVRDNSYWKFYAPGKTDVITKYCSSGKNQQDLPNALGERCGMAAILSVGKVKKDNGGNDNSPTSSIDMSNYLIISTCGNGLDGEDTCYPQSDDIKNAIPVAEYIGSEAGGNFSPNDDDTTNYIVVSGKVILNPLMVMSGWYNPMHDSDCAENGTVTNGIVELPVTFGSIPIVDMRTNNGLYTRRHWKAETWQTAVSNDTAPDSALNRGFIPFTDNGPQSYKFEYSAVGDSTDQISKVAVIACMLVIGDKVCVEKLPSEGGSGNGQFSDFEWRTYKERSECSSDDEYYQQCFTVGFDPAIGDYLIGKEYSIQNNISYTDGVDAEGTAIPIKKSDKVSGKVQFKILGPVNTVWDEVTRRHPTFFRHTKWGSNSIPLLAHTSNILLKEFEVKVYSDNAKMGSGSDDTDIVYLSDTKETFINKKDDLEFKLTTALTSAECKTLGVKNQVKLSSPTLASGDALLSITDTNSGTADKPEKLYVDAYWQEWHEPRVVMTQNFEDGTHISPWNLYRHPAIGKTFHVEGISRNLREGTAEITMKEIF